MDPTALHIFFLPSLAPGHMIPMVDMARVFAEHGVKATIVTTPVNASRIRPNIDLANDVGRHHQIEILQIPFPSSDVGLPEGWENITCFPTPDGTPEFLKAIELLCEPFDRLLREHRLDGIISDLFYPWTADSGLEFGIPWLVFHGGSSFTLVVSEQLGKHKPHDRVSSDEECFIVPGLPHRIEMRRSQLPSFVLAPDDSIGQMASSLRKSYG